MLKVEINKSQNLEKALKVLKGKVIKTKQNENSKLESHHQLPHHQWSCDQEGDPHRDGRQDHLLQVILRTQARP